MSESTSKWWALLGIGLGVLMFSVDISIVYVSLPTLVETFHTSFAIVQWVALSYLITIAASIVGVGRLGDMFDKKTLYLVGLLIFTFGSLLCGMATTVGFLIGFRAIQGLGAVFIAALGAAIVTEVFAVSERGLTLGIIGALGSLGVILGPTLGGLLIDLGSWHLIFFANVPIGIATGAVVIYAVPPSVARDRQRNFDILGALTIALTLICLALGMTFGQLEGFGTPIPIALLAIAALGFAGFLRVETWVFEPMLDLGIFRNLQFGLSLLVGWIVYTVMAGTVFILPFFLELAERYSVRKVGLLQAVLPIAVGLVEPISGSLSDRFGWRTISFIGSIVMVGGCLTIGTLDDNLTATGYIARMIPLGVGMGIFISPNNTAIMSNVSQERLGVASALLSLCRVLGHIVGVPLLGSLFVALSRTEAKLAQSFDLTNANITNISVPALVFAENATFYIAACILAIAVLLLIYGMFQDRSNVRSG